MKLDPKDPKSVAEWALRRVDAGLGDRWLWARRTLDGVGYMLTEKDESPSGGAWMKVGKVEWEDASAFVRADDPKTESHVRLRAWNLRDRLSQAVAGTDPR